MKTVCVIQHTEAEYLGLMEEHFEGRNVRFHYRRPFTPGGVLPASPEGFDALMLLGGGPYGLVSGHLLPSAGHELRLTRAFLDAGLPVLGLELGAIILAVAAGGGAVEAPLRFRVETAKASDPDCLGGYLPRQFPIAAYLRDAPVLPEEASVLATSPEGEPLVFSVAENSLGFLGHPGMKRGMAEDLIMEFEEGPENPVPQLERLRLMVREIEDALVPVMTGIIQLTGLMQMRRRIPLELKN